MGLTVPPYILGEVLLRGHRPRADTLARLRHHGVIIGLEPVGVAQRLARLTKNEFAGFEPFPTPGEGDHELYRSLLYEDRPTLSTAAAHWARQTKNARLTLNEHFRRVSTEVRALARGHKKFHRLSDAPFADATRRSFAWQFFASNGKRAMVVKNASEFYLAAMSNPYLRHFLGVWLFFTVSLSRLWANQELNRDAVATRDDLADVTLALYVGNHDAILTRDKLLVDAFRLVEPSVRVLTDADL